MRSWAANGLRDRVEPRAGFEIAAGGTSLWRDGWPFLEGSHFWLSGRAQAGLDLPWTIGLNTFVEPRYRLFPESQAGGVVGLGGGVCVWAVCGEYRFRAVDDVEDVALGSHVLVGSVKLHEIWKSIDAFNWLSAPFGSYRFWLGTD